MKTTSAFIFIREDEKGAPDMTTKQALCSAVLAIPLILAGAGPSAADVEAEFGFGWGSPYYGMSPFYYPHYGYGLYAPYGGAYYGDEFVEDDEVEIIEPAAAPAEPASCVKTNVKNFKNACPN
jgi:hypothetical protein